MIGRIFGGDSSVRRRLNALWAADRGGDAIWDVLLLWAAAHAGSPQATSIVLACGAAPQIVVPLFGGVIATRVGPWRMLVWTSTAKVLAVLAIAVVFLIGAPWGWIALLAGCMGLAEGLHLAPFFSLPKQVSGDSTRTSAHDTQAIGQAALMLAAPLTGFVLGWDKVAAAAMCIAVLLTARLLLLPLAAAASHPSSTKGRPTEAPAAMLRRGISYGFREAPEVRAGLVTFAVANVCTTPVFMIGLPLHALSTGWSAWVWGLVYGAFMAGGVVGPLASNRFEDSLRLTWFLLIPGAVGMGAAVSVSNWAVAAAGAFLAGACFQAGVAMTRERIYAAAAPEYQARIQGLVATSAYSLIAVSHLAFGAALAAWPLGVLGWLLAGSLTLFALVMLATQRSFSASQTAAAN